VSAVADWYDEKSVAETYHAEAREVLQSILGPGAKVFPTGGHILRDELPLVRDAALQAPARSVHNDVRPILSPSSPLRSSDIGSSLCCVDSSCLCVQFAPSFAKNFKQDARLAAALDSGAMRLVTLNLWRNISDQPMQRMPLALLDRRSIAQEDVRPVPLDGDGVGGGHEIMVGNYNPNHEWYYYPNLTRDEVMVFVTFDSADGDAFIPTMHTAIDLPGTDGLQGRESCEIRINALVPTGLGGGAKL